MLNLLRAPCGVYIVSLSISVDEFPNRHSVMLSTIKESGKFHGKIIDNSKLHPVYLEGKDKKKIKAVLKKLGEKSSYKSSVIDDSAPVCYLCLDGGGRRVWSAIATRLCVPRHRCRIYSPLVPHCICSNQMGTG
jgi:hypothetical protein